MNIYVGKKISFTKKIDKNLIFQFSKLSGDNNPIHVNEAYVKKTSFKKIVAHGMLSETFLSTIIGTKLPGKGSLWIEKEVKFTKIVRVNDLITFNAEVKFIEAINLSVIASPKPCAPPVTTATLFFKSKLIILIFLFF